MKDDRDMPNFTKGFEKFQKILQLECNFRFILLYVLAFLDIFIYKRREGNKMEQKNEKYE